VDVASRLEQASVAIGRGEQATVVGAHVRIRDVDTSQVEEYDIVGSGQADPAAGRISSESPIGSALLGRYEGEVVDVETPIGTRRLTILEVRRSEPFGD
jgi:transcription elongation factor GreA